MTTHFKLGLLTIITLAAVVITALALGLRGRAKDTYHTYFDESVHGLEIGAQVKYRGVPIGTVSDIEIAPDNSLVRVDLAIERDRVRALGLGEPGSRARTQLVYIGITGLKIVELDVVDPEEFPPPPLTFEPAQPYIPARPSLMKRVEAGLLSTEDRLPVLVDRMISTLEKIELVVDDVRQQEIPERVGAIVATADGAVADLRRFVRHLDRADVPEKLATAIDRLDGAAVQLNQILAQVDGDDGLMASARRASESFGDLGRSTSESTSELERTLREVGDAARAVRDFMEQLEREPDMLMKGRARRSKL